MSLTLGERQYRHKRHKVVQDTIRLYEATLYDDFPTLTRRTNAHLRRLARTIYSTPSLIHNGRKPRNV